MGEEISLEPWPRPSTETVDWYLGGQRGAEGTPPGYLGWGKSAWLPEDRILRRFESSQSCRLNGSSTCGKLVRPISDSVRNLLTLICSVRTELQMSDSPICIRTTSLSALLPLIQVYSGLSRFGF